MIEEVISGTEYEVSRYNEWLNMVLELRNKLRGAKYGN